ncbi:hypothetical protein CB0940_11494 [Cercospora beticola]|uniref:Uncharacterized protein n=1 Tax=Cercospora beticola TaxID=122368 RepID=A0A2G5HDU8_CERBT|nr:hypothetical protein CB0940_11494 [Cercospora beticola]PIA90698.1 hypothetical protein CB0940_11494 [Cercospora beticola]WPB08359.1 hypothetical protein RHO25_013025 [Cercospora beticola]CAK1367745.1 unnamed protein product [Cercospora beticola]
MMSVQAPSAAIPFSLLRELPQVTASMDQGWTYSAIESWIEDTIQKLSVKAGPTKMLSTLVSEDIVLAAVCCSCLRILVLCDPESATETIESLHAGTGANNVQALVVNMSNCHRCSGGKLGRESIKSSFFEDQALAATGMLLKQSMLKPMYIRAGPDSNRVLKSTEEEILGAAAGGLYVMTLDASNMKTTLATQALSQLVQEGIS